MGSLVDAWDTFMMPARRLREETRQTVEDSTTLQSFYCNTFRGQVDDSALSSAQQDLASACPLPVSPSSSAEGKEMKPSSHLWLLSLVSHNKELMQAVSRLFLQFNQQFTDVVERHRQEMEELQARQEMQLAALLDVDVDVSTDMIVNSSVTEHLVLQHQREVESLMAACAARERAAEAELQRYFYDVLNTSAPDAIAALAAKAAAQEDEHSHSFAGERGADSSLRGAEESMSANGSMRHSSSGESSRRKGPLQYKAEVDVSRFTQRYSSPLQGAGTADLPSSVTAPVTLSVPVRTVLLAGPSPVLKPLTGQKASSSSASRAVVLDLSPTSALAGCLTSCQDPLSPMASAAAEEHLMRLAHAKHALLFLVGPSKAARELLQSSPSPELLLGRRSQRDDEFVALPGEPRLQVLFTTRFWGANIILHWDPAATAAPASLGSSQTLATSTSASHSRLPGGGASLSVSEDGPVVVESALRLAFSWNVDMFSLALLPGVGASTARTGLPTELAAHTFAFDALGFLRDAMASILVENAHSRTPQLWTVQDEELLSRKYWSETSAPSCPRAVGVRYVGQGSQGERVSLAESTSSGGQGSPLQNRPHLAPPHTAAVGRGGAPPEDNGFQRRALSLPLAFKGSALLTPLPPPVYFNTPMAIRVFLPLPDTCFGPPETVPEGVSAGEGSPPHGAVMGAPTFLRAVCVPGGPSNGAGRTLSTRINSNSSGGGGVASAFAGRQPASHTSDGSPLGASYPRTHVDADGEAMGGSFATDARQRHRSQPPVEHLSLAEIMRYAFGGEAKVY